MRESLTHTHTQLNSQGTARAKYYLNLLIILDGIYMRGNKLLYFAITEKYNSENFILGSRISKKFFYIKLFQEKQLCNYTKKFIYQKLPINIKNASELGKQNFPYPGVNNGYQDKSPDNPYTHILLKKHLATSLLGYTTQKYITY